MFDVFREGFSALPFHPLTFILLVMSVYQLPVYYGWAKISKVVKHEALTVVFLNSSAPPRIAVDGVDGVSRFIDIVYKRWQTADEMRCAHRYSRLYSLYSIRLSDVDYSLDRALAINFDSDRFHLSARSREIILAKLKASYLARHPDYREPCCQLYFDF